MATKRLRTLYRSYTNQVLGGVLAGVADYFSHEPIVWRIGFIIFLLVTGLMPGVFIYAAAWILVPVEPDIVPLDEEDYTVFN